MARDAQSIDQKIHKNLVTFAYQLSRWSCHLSAKTHENLVNFKCLLLAGDSNSSIHRNVTINQ